jgi:ABC-2 type transport system permease protein
MKTIDIITKNMKELIRDKKNLFFLLLFPIIFMLVFGVAFGGDSTTNPTIDIAIVNQDVDVNNHSYSQMLIDNIKDVKTNDSKKMFNIIETDSQDHAQKLLESDNVSCILIIPDDFSKNMQEEITKQSNNTPQITFKADTTQTNNMIAQNVIDNIINEYSININSQLTSTSFNAIKLNIEGLEGTKDFTQFDYIAPGLIIFAILMTVTTVTSSISRETENGMLKRLKLSYMKSSDYIIGNLATWCIMGIIQVIIMLLVAVFMGFHWNGGLNSLLLACLVGFIATIPSVALALIIVSLTSSVDQATNLSAIIAVPLSFLAGSFFPLPEAYICEFMGHHIQIYELLPWNQALTALRQLLLYGNGIEAIWINILLILIIGIILLAISILLFKHKISTEY